LDSVNAVWAGLGYYSRARRLHEGAKHVLQKHEGNLPRNLEELKSIPGIGPYTAGAIASIAFGLPAPVVDGNVVRVFARLRALHGEAQSPVLIKQCWELAEALIDPDHPREFNQALMELGATICTPQAPACDRCPVKEHCRAAALHTVDADKGPLQFPGRAIRKAPKLRQLAVAVVEDASGHVLLSKRAPTGLLAGQWEFPSVLLNSCTRGCMKDVASDMDTKGEDVDKPYDAVAAQHALERKLHAEYTAFFPGCIMPVLAPVAIPPIEHVFSHERHTMHLFRACIGQELLSKSNVLNPDDTRCRLESAWISVDAAEVGFTSGVQKILKTLGLIKLKTCTKEVGHKRSADGIAITKRLRSTP